MEDKNIRILEISKSVHSTKSDRDVEVLQMAFGHNDRYDLKLNLQVPCKLIFMSEFVETMKT